MSSTSLVRRFHLGQLERDRWTHEAHAVVGLWTLVAVRALHTHDSARSPAVSAALDILRHKISAHNERVGITNSGTSGYHETLTWFYLDRIARIVEESGVNVPTVTRVQLDRLTEIVLADPRVSRNAARAAYGDEALASPEARSSVIAPLANRPDAQLTTGQLTSAA